jgi:hypothetical protein
MRIKVVSAVRLPEAYQQYLHYDLKSAIKKRVDERWREDLIKHRASDMKMPPATASTDHSSTSEDDTVIKVPINSTFSDGNPDVWPTDPRYRKADPSLYLDKLARMWMKQRGELRPGKKASFSDSHLVFIWSLCFWRLRQFSMFSIALAYMPAFVGAGSLHDCDFIVLVSTLSCHITPRSKWAFKGQPVFSTRGYLSPWHSYVLVSLRR